MRELTRLLLSLEPGVIICRLPAVAEPGVSSTGVDLWVPLKGVRDAVPTDRALSTGVLACCALELGNCSVALYS